VTLFDLLTGMIFLAPLISAIETAKHARRGFPGYAIAVILGPLLAILFGWADNKKNRWLVETIERRKFSGFFYWSLPILSIALFIIGSMSGIWLTTRLLSLIS
jgi:hypothetical protein